MGGEPDRLFSKPDSLSSKPRSLSSEQEELFGESELEDLDRLLNGLPGIRMQDWEGFLDKFLDDIELPVLAHAGRLSHRDAVDIAGQEYGRFAEKRRRQTEKKAALGYIEELKATAETLEQQRKRGGGK